jgi:hypothetical protein
MRERLRLYPTIRAMFPWVGSALVLALAGLAVVRALVPPGVLRDSNDSVGNYLQTLGTIYAVLLAFVVFVVWQQFNDTRGHVEAEANELLDLARTAKGLPPKIGERFVEEANGYLDQVLAREWPAMARGDEKELERGDLVLQRMWDLLVSYEPCSECHKSLYDEALARFNDLSDRRSSRLSSSRLRIPFALRLLLYSGGVMTVASMYLLAVDRFAIHALITAALAGAISHVLYIIADLDDCFDGAWQIPSAPFERVRRYLTMCEQETHGVPVPVVVSTKG